MISFRLLDHPIGEYFLYRKGCSGIYGYDNIGFATSFEEAKKLTDCYVWVGTVSEKQIRIRCWNPNIEEWTLDITEDKQKLRDYADEPCSEYDDDDDDEG